MKRKLSYLLAIILIIVPCMRINAFENDFGKEVSKNDKTSETAETEEIETEEFTSEEFLTQEVEAEGVSTEDIQKNEPKDKNSIGQVDVSVTSGMFLEKSVELTVSLTGQNSKYVIMPSDKESGQQAAKKGVSFENLAPGNYTLTVSGAGFAEYTQELEVGNQALFIKLITGFVDGYDYENGPHPGILMLGDVNGDSIIDDNDRKLLIDAIDLGSQSKDMDLNGDNEVNLVDLEAFARGYQEKPVSSTIEQGVPANAVEVKCDNSVTTVNGDLSLLMTNEGGSVKLAPAEGGEITGSNPVSLEFDFAEKESRLVEGIAINSMADNPIRSMEAVVKYTDSEGKEQTVNVPLEEGIDFLLESENVKATQEGNGIISIDFGTRIAVKKVTFIIKGMKKNSNLAEISKVEFLNGMENRIPEPELDIPQNVSVHSGNKTFSMTWNPCVNVTGYEVSIQHEGEEEFIITKGNTLTVSSFKGDKMKNGEDYLVKVRAVNGTWRSGYSDITKVIMKTDKKPDAPDYLKVTGTFKAINATWKKMEDTDSYNLYYREAGETSYTKVEGIAANSYTINNLKDKTSYEVYVTGVNELGEGKPSLTGMAETTDPEPVQMPRYKLINNAEAGKVSEHIINAYYVNGGMADSPLDTEGKTAWGTVDNNPYSHFFLNSWDSGGYNNLGVNGVTYEFDQPYKLQTFALTEVSEQSPSYGYVRVRYWDEDGKAIEINRMGIQKKLVSGNRSYYIIRLPEAVTAKKIQFGVSRVVASGTITFSEVYFYHYDSLEDDIMALYQDDLHTVLRSDVTQATIDELRTRINTVDEVSKEYHPDREKLERELKTAEDILNSVLSSSVQIHNTITTGDVNRGFGGLNAWQPLGVTAAAGEEITVYVGHNTKKTGESTNLQLVSTQYHAEASSMFKVVATLKVGRNDIVIPKLSTINAEAGGALYVQYTNNNANDRYAVRVSGGAEVPVLDLYQVTDRTERLERAEKYIEDLKFYVKWIEANHDKYHKESKNVSVNRYDYQAQNCILGASDIMLDKMLLSLPAQQILTGSGGSAETLVDSMEAMENMLNLFYQHKGLNNAAGEKKDKLPSGHLNIRYQRMFAGAFMYASGNHIGIEWNETKGMVSGKSVQADENGKHISGQYFGWGIAHEIGHCINQGSYAVAEVTNNYFSVLAQAKDNNNSVRFKYANVYDKVTSGTKGAASNVFTQLGMYWQLHLAYDDGYNYKTYENYDEQLNNLFFARVDTYSRTPAKAPAPNGIALSLSGDKNQILMRLSCAAAGKNLLEFFERWGMTPDEGTIKYAEQFEKETRAIYYANDDSRVYRLENAATGSSLGTEGNIEAVGSSTTAVVNVDSANQVDITLSSDNRDILGYEIVRCTTSGGEVEKEVVGFTTGSSFTDYVTTMNNRVVTYEITAIDHYLNRSAAKQLNPLKIEHRGNIDKTNWTVSTNDMTDTVEEVKDDTDNEDTCGAEPEQPIKNAVDNKADTVYKGVAGKNAEVILEFNQTHTITGFEYKVTQGTAISDYQICIRDEQGNWKEAANGKFGDSKVIYFENEGNIASYNTTAVKLVIKNQAGKEIAISELDVFGVTGDNVDFVSTAENPAIGILESDFIYDSEGNFIPAGSIIFTGSYKGNPAYNVVVLYDSEGNIVSANEKAEHIILADVPATGNIQDVSDGKWVYWIEPNDADVKKLKSVRAELYRVDNALTNEGQRLVSDSYFVEVPEVLPQIKLTQNSGN